MAIFLKFRGENKKHLKPPPKETPHDTISGIFRDPQYWDPCMVSFSYYSHTTSISKLGVPENPPDTMQYYLATSSGLSTAVGPQTGSVTGS